MELSERVRILGEGAKYDVSCSSSGSSRAGKAGATGNTAACGICHSFTADGRCISLLKILMTNNCIYDCLYCVNRRSNDIPRASLSVDELCSLVMDFYKRNYIEGLFLSSAIEFSPNRTMETLLDAVTKLRKVYNFRGYIHLKALPHADPVLIQRASRFVDRMSVNIELPTSESLRLLAPSKTKDSILLPMRQLHEIVEDGGKSQYRPLPAGQTTQLIVGATGDSDSTILKLSEALYRKMQLKRVYYSAYIPLGTSSLLPTQPVRLIREHRLYQADWLIRFYGFDADEITAQDHNLNLDLDPKCDWAMRNLGLFPIEINTAPSEMLLRIPGVGLRSAERIAKARMYNRLTFEDLKKMRVVLKRAVHFITVNGQYRGSNLESSRPLLLLNGPEQQLNMFGNELSTSVITGEF